MWDKTGELWHMRYMNGEPVLLILNSKPTSTAYYTHRCLIVDSGVISGPWSTGNVRTIAGWGNVPLGFSNEWGWNRIA